METFENLGKQKTVAVVLSYEEAAILQDALQYYCENNKKKKKAVALFKTVENLWPYVK